MKIAYLFESTNSREILENMIIPQMEKGIHGADVVGMMFFFDNCYMLVEGNDIADRLSALAEKTGMLLMCCVNVGEAADTSGGNQLLVDLALIAATVAAHQQHAGLFSQSGQTVSNVIALDQHIAVVEEEHHADDISAVDALFHLGDDHVFQNLSGVGGFKQVSDFHVIFS